MNFTSVETNLRKVTCSKLSYGLVRTFAPAKSVLTPFCNFVSDSELAPCPLGEMCFPFRDYLHSGMWPSNFLRRSGNAWPLLRGPCIGTWCWIPTGTWSPWVRITSLRKLVTSSVYLWVFPSESQTWDSLACLWKFQIPVLKTVIEAVWIQNEKASWHGLSLYNFSFLQKLGIRAWSVVVAGY